MRHGYKGAFEIAATVDYLFAFAATTNAVKDHHFDALFDAYLGDETVRGLHRRGQSGGAGRDRGALRTRPSTRGLWRPRRNDIARPSRRS